MGNTRSKPITTINIFVTLSFIKENQLEVLPLKVKEIKNNSDIKFIYFSISNKEKGLIEKNYPFNLVITDRITNKEEKFYFSESYRYNDKDYNINTNVINNSKWFDYNVKNRKDIKIRHNKYLEPQEVIISE